MKELTFKVGDIFWVDYDGLVADGEILEDWKRWFPPEEAPFVIEIFNRYDLTADNGYCIRPSRIYNKNRIIHDILADL